MGVALAEVDEVFAASLTGAILLLTLATMASSGWAK
jgi:hypothetical protein